MQRLDNQKPGKYGGNVIMINSQYQDKTELMEMNSRTDGPFCARISKGWITDELLLKRDGRPARFPTMQTLMDAVIIVRNEAKLRKRTFQVFRDDGFPGRGKLFHIGHTRC